MKIFFSLLLSILMLSSSNIKAQITYEQTYPGPNSVASVRMQLINLGYNDYKFAEVNYATNQLKLFNLDHSPYVSINLPVPLINTGEYTVGYVTKALFDCDTSKFEYAIMSQSNWKNSFYIYRQDGTLLFQRDSTIAPYCLGCFSGSYDVRPIVNSPAGAKLFLMKPDTGLFKTTDVYSLCGTLPINGMEPDAASASFVKVFPNPTNGETSFEFDFPSNTQNYDLVIYNSSAQVISTIGIPGTTGKYRLDSTHLSPGLYFFTLNADQKIFQNGKFIITK